MDREMGRSHLKNISNSLMTMFLMKFDMLSVLFDDICLFMLCLE